MLSLSMLNLFRLGRTHQSLSCFAAHAVLYRQRETKIGTTKFEIRCHQQTNKFSKSKNRWLIRPEQYPNVKY